MTDSVRMVRLTADQAGDSRFDEVEAPLVMQEFAPPAAPLLVSASEAASGYVHIRLPAGWIGDAHPSPHRQILFCLKGSMDVFSSAGEKRRISAGDIWVMADTSGMGHRTIVVDGPVDAVIVRLAKGD
jgi:quercetin dioxygenase-like cupin family protein